MKRALSGLLAATLAITVLSTASMAASNENAKVLLHVVSSTCKNCCATAQVACNDIVTAADADSSYYFVFVLVTDGDPVVGLAAVQFGIDYPGEFNPEGGPGPIEVFSWGLCATLEFNVPPWPGPGGGNLVTWDYTTVCQRTEPGGPGTGVVAVAGYFYMAAYAPGRMSIIPRPVDGTASVGGCDILEYPVETPSVHRTPSHLGFADFGGGPGYNPCGLNTPVQNTTWSQVKSQYRDL